MRATKPLHIGGGTTPVPVPVPAVTTEWRGTVSGSFSTAGNWTNGVPGTSANAVFNQGSVDCDADLDQSAVFLSSLLVHSDYTGNIGDGTNSLQVSAGLVKINKKTGFVHLDGLLFFVHILNTSGDTNAVKLNGTASLACIYGTRSDVLFDTGIAVGSCYAIPRAGSTVELDINVGSATDQNILHVDRNAFVTTAYNTTSIYCDGGVLTLLDDVDSTTLEIGGGTLINKATGTHASLELWDGVYSMHQNTDLVELEVTSPAMWGGRMVLHSGMGHGTVFNPLAYWGGELWADVGRTVSQAAALCECSGDPPPDPQEDP